MLFSLALIPVIIILVFIYVKDKKEKEPIGLLIGLFFAGMATVITAIIAELVGELIFEAIWPYESALKQFLLAMLVVAPAEELGKYMVLRLITWKNKNFNYSYDAIVYAVFVSLGFAAFENVGYVFMNGIGTAFIRMFTAVPGHAADAVFMGYFYSRAKYASLKNDKSEYSKNLWLTILVPIITHGLYDGIIFSCSTGENVLYQLSGLILWIVFVIVLFVFSIITIVKASKNDFCIAYYPGNVQALYMPSYGGDWICNCGMVNQYNFCSRCGSMRPVIDTTWYCPRCGSPSAYNFCGCCGLPKPQVQPMMQPQMQPQPPVMG